MSLRSTHSPAVAAAKSGFSTAAAYRIEADPRPCRDAQSPRAATTRSPGRGLGGRDPADAEGGAGTAPGGGSRGGATPPAGDRRRRPPHAGAAHPQLAGAEWAGEGGDLPPGAPARKARPVRLHRPQRAWRHHRRRGAGLSALPLPPGLLGLRAWSCGAGRRELRRPGRGTAERALGAWRGARAAPRAAASRPPSATWTRTPRRT